MARRKTPYEEITGIPEDSTTRLMREMHDSPSERIRRDLEGLIDDSAMRKYREGFATTSLLKVEDSAGGRYVREMEEKLFNDPIQRRYDRQIAEAKAFMIDPMVKSLDRQLGDAAARMKGDPAMRVLDVRLAEAKTRYLASPTVLALDRQIDDARARLIADMRLSDIDRRLATANLDAMGLASASVVDRATVNAYRDLLSMGSTGGNLFAKYEAVASWSKLFGEPVLAGLTGNLSDLARTNQWASALGSAAQTSLAGLYHSGAIAEEISRIEKTVLSYAQGSDDLDRARLSSTLGLFHSVDTELSATRLKLSALAGASDVLGFQAKTSESAYQELFGHWSTRPDLPARFWNDPKKRRRMYDEAEVDVGLIESNPQVAIELVIESGFTAGVADANQSVALLDISGVSMSVRSSNLTVDAYRALIVFEQGLRRFIAGKLAAVAGPSWAKQRIDGSVHAKAKQNRATAIAGGETDDAILAYIDLGELLGIMTRKDNWDQVFGHVFPSRPRLESDMQALVAIRRPTMHARKIDSVRLVEMLCVMRRLNQYIASDGGWKLVADADD